MTGDALLDPRSVKEQPTTPGTRLCFDVESTSITLIQRRNNVVYSQKIVTHGFSIPGPISSIVHTLDISLFTPTQFMHKPLFNQY